MSGMPLHRQEVVDVRRVPPADRFSLYLIPFLRHSPCSQPLVAAPECAAMFASLHDVGRFRRSMLPRF